MTGVIEATMTLGELVTRHPGLARELEIRGLDYCCGGHRTLAAACAADRPDLDTAVLVDELRAELTTTAAGPPDWASMDAAELTEHIESTHHRFVRAELPRLTALLDTLVDVHGSRHPELYAVRQRFGELRAELEPHLDREEQELFPTIRRQAASTHPPGLDASLAELLLDHGRAGELLAALRRLTDGYAPPADGCATYEACYAALAELEADTHLHVHKENNLLFPAVVESATRRAAS